MNSEYYIALVGAGVVAIVAYFVACIRHKQAYRRVVPVPQSLLSLGVEKRCYPDPHTVTFFVGGNKVGGATARLVQKDMDELIARGHRVVQTYRDTVGSIVNVSPDALSRLKVSLKDMEGFTQGRPERHPEFQKVFPYAYISITLV